MNINQYIESRIVSLFEKFKDSSMSDMDLIKSLREEADKSSILFYFLLEKMLVIALSKGCIILSKGLLKYYLKSDYKEYPDYVYIGGTAKDDDESIIKSVHGIVIKKGIFIKIIEKLNLNNMLNSYIKFLIIQEPEINEQQYLSKKEIENYSDIDSVIEIMYNEFDKKIEPNKRILDLNQ